MRVGKFLVSFFFFAFAFRCLLYTLCTLWVGLWAPFIHYIYYLSVLSPIKKKINK